MTASRATDVLIVGLGPAGACAAVEAAKAGLSVLAIERKASAGKPVQCAEFVPSPMGMEVDNLAANSLQPITSMVTFVEQGPGETVEQFPGLMIDREQFDAQLASAAVQAGAECRFGINVQALNSDGSAQLSDGQAVKPRILIGADGPRSHVGEAIGQVNTKIAETRQITVPLHEQLASTDIFLSAAFPGGYGWLFPKGNQANLGMGLKPELKHELKPLLAELHQTLVDAGRVGETISAHTGGAIPVGGMLKPFGQVGDVHVLLAGDAAGLTNPVTGAGINAAVLSGRRAGQCAADLLAGNANAQQDYAEELEDLLKPSLDRALARRRTLLEHYVEGSPNARDLRASWIAYPEYWAA
ncbi:MAG: NAD(P)/FAD-dependent oxidoreductase [Alphaproteobacteria bacterium]|nr:NAD(P)/FAD-dependent oxidoreductase [Alphaproteobacteria bacterium]